MDASLSLVEERDPDFFALLNMHFGKRYTKVYEDTSGVSPHIFGCGSIITRDAWVNGEKNQVGYACDLRIESKYRRGKIFPTGLDAFVNYVSQDSGVDVMYFAMLSDNTRAKQAFFSPSDYRKDQPIVKTMTPYNMVSIQFTGSMAKPNNRVSRAKHGDIDELIHFIATKEKQRQFGFVFDDTLLNQRLAHWPDFSLEDFYIVRDRNNRIVACAAPWNNESSIRRSRVVNYKNEMRVLRRLYDAEAKLRGFSPLPNVGDCFHFASLTHCTVKDDNPAFLNDLLKGIYQDYRVKNLHFISLSIPLGSPLEKGIKGFRTRNISMELFSLVPRKSPLAGMDFRTIDPGFEMALH